MTTITTAIPNFIDTVMVDRILAKVTTDDNGCWNWGGTKNPKGYGVITIRGRRRPAHRVAYEATFGPLPEGLEPDHLCRNRPCCNPAHLEAVTHAENVRRAGQYQPNLKITLEEAQQVREAYTAGGVTQRALAAQFGISATLVNFIVKDLRKPAA